MFLCIPHQIDIVGRIDIVVVEVQIYAKSEQGDTVLDCMSGKNPLKARELEKYEGLYDTSGNYQMTYLHKTGSKHK